MTRIMVAGPPRRAQQARIGFGYVLPLSAVPPDRWAEIFETVEWPTVNPSLRPPYNPRLDGNLIWLPSRVSEDLQILNDVVDIIDAVTAAHDAAQSEREAEERETAQVRAQRLAEESERLESWWRTRPTPRSVEDE